MTDKKLNFVPQKANANKHTSYGLRLLEKSVQGDGWLDAQTAAADGEISWQEAEAEVNGGLFCPFGPVAERPASGSGGSPRHKDTQHLLRRIREPFLGAGHSAASAELTPQRHRRRGDACRAARPSFARGSYTYYSPPVSST